MAETPRPWNGIPAIVDLERNPVTPEELDRVAQTRERQFRKFANGGARLTLREKELAHAITRERNAAANVARLEAHLAESLTAGQHAGVPNRVKMIAAWRAECRRELAEQRRAHAKGLRDQGRIEEAAAADPTYTDKLEAGRVAIARDDADLCICADTALPHGGEASRFVHVKEMPVLEVGGTLGYRHLLRCSRCGHMNAVAELPASLASDLERQKNVVPSDRNTHLPDKVHFKP